MKTFILLAVFVFAGWYGYSQSQRREHVPDAIPEPAVVESAPDTRFTCDGRTHCSQMTSCAEATYFLKNCPGTKMDGNDDGVPCEKQWCK